MVLVTSEDSPTRKSYQLQDLGAAPLRGELADHNWYPAVQRCACGLNLRSATHWVSHICQVAARTEEATA